MRLVELLNVIAYTNLEEYIRISICKKHGVDAPHEKEFADIEVTCRNIAFYADYEVLDVALGENKFDIIIGE